MSAEQDIQTGLDRIWTSDFVQKNPKKSYQAYHPAEYNRVKAYVEGGAEPSPWPTTLLGDGLALVERGRRAITLPGPDPEPEPEPGTITIRNFSDLEGLWAPDWVSPAAPVVRADGGGITGAQTPYGSGFRFVATPAMGAPWNRNARHTLCRALVTEGKEGQQQVSRWHMLMPASGNVNGIMDVWHAGTFWEVGHLPSSLGDGSGHNIKVCGKDPSLPPDTLLAGIHKAPWSAGAQDYDWQSMGVLKLDHWYECEETITWSIGDSGRYEFKLDGQVRAQRSGATMPQAGAPYGPQFGWYSTIDPAYPYTNEIIFGGIEITLT